MSPRTTQQISARQLARQRDAELEAEQRTRRLAALGHSTAFEAGRRQRDEGERAMASAVVGLLGLSGMTQAELRRRTGATDSELRRLAKLGRGQPDSPEDQPDQHEQPRKSPRMPPVAGAAATTVDLP